MVDLEQQDDFLSVIEANKGLIYKVTNTFCKDLEDKKDLFQEISMKIWKSFESYSKEFKHSTWVYRIALNTAISFYRKEKSRKSRNAPLSEGVFNLADFQDNLQIERGAYLLSGFISELKELDRALILLYLEEKSHREIAEIIGISESNVSTKISRIKSILKQKFSQTQI
jgi:RNA polymerase sigma-70 factor (ECF subfamily)